MYHPLHPTKKEQISMKTKLIALVIVALMGAGKTHAQDVFQQVVNTNKLIIEDPRATGLTLSLAQFKYTSMQYLCNMALKVNNGSVDGNFLDRQATAMNNFVTGYISELTQGKDNQAKKEVMMRYWKASAQNPLFGDKDKETTQAFATDPTSITPFSLDTNWELADNARQKK